MRVTRMMHAEVLESQGSYPFKSLPTIESGRVIFDLRNGTVKLPEGEWSTISVFKAMGQGRAWMRQYWDERERAFANRIDYATNNRREEIRTNVP